jgi:hypothetical protein
LDLTNNNITSLDALKDSGMVNSIVSGVTSRGYCYDYIFNVIEGNKITEADARENLPEELLNAEVYTYDAITNKSEDTGKTWVESQSFYTGEVTEPETPAVSITDYSPVFNAYYYYNNNPDVAAAFGKDDEALLNHFVNYGMSEGRQASENFNVNVYRAENADLAAAFGDNTAAYYQHYIAYGVNENRVAVSNAIYNGVDYSAVYDKDYYLSNNSDLQAALGDNADALIRHFVEYGMSEGRQASANFNVNVYRAENADVAAAFGDNTAAYYQHYIAYGVNENRVAVSNAIYNGVDYSAVYNKDYYLSNNSDLQAAFGDDAQALIRHFVEYGMSEGRQASADFNVNVYKAQNADLAAAFGDNTAAYYQHYIAYGVNENRVAVSNAVYNGVDYSAVYDKDYYLSSNADLQAAFGDDAEALISHFAEYGMSEGRQAKADFNAYSYMEKYEDLRNAFGEDLKAYYVHYINYGQAEGREGV